MEKGGCNKHMGGMAMSKPKEHAKGMNPKDFARNNMAKGGVNHQMAKKGKK